MLYFIHFTYNHDRAIGFFGCWLDDTYELYANSRFDKNYC